MDRYLQGLRPGELTVVTADTGVGKTTWCTHLAINAAMQKAGVWICSWEMRPEIILRKIASIALRKPMKLTDFNIEDSKAFDVWCDKYSVYINPSTSVTNIDSIEAGIIEAKKNDVKVILLDHLDYLVKNNKEKQHEAIEESVRRLHEIALSQSVHILLICHPKQSSSGDDIGLHSLKGSSAIKQYADNVIVLYRASRTDPTADPGKVRVRIAKNRMFGTEGNTYLFYQPEWDGYLELGDAA